MVSFYRSYRCRILHFLPSFGPICMQDIFSSGISLSTSGLRFISHAWFPSLAPHPHLPIHTPNSAVLRASAFLDSTFIVKAITLHEKPFWLNLPACTPFSYIVSHNVIILKSYLRSFVARDIDLRSCVGSSISGVFLCFLLFCSRGDI